MLRNYKKSPQESLENYLKEFLPYEVPDRKMAARRCNLNSRIARKVHRCRVFTIKDVLSCALGIQKLSSICGDIGAHEETKNTAEYHNTTKEASMSHLVQQALAVEVCRQGGSQLRFSGLPTPPLPPAGFSNVRFAKREHREGNTRRRTTSYTVFERL